MDEHFDPVLRNVLVGASDLLPDFNDEFLLKFRENSIKKIPDYLDQMFHETTKLFKGVLRYVGYERLTPDDRIKYIKENTILKKKIPIQKSSFEQLRFLFEFEGEQYPLHISVPYLEHGCVVLSDTQYFPMFAEVERGGLHRIQEGLIIKVMRAPLTFRRSEQFSFSTVEGKAFREIVPTVKIHQGKRGRGKRAGVTPNILNHHVEKSFDQTMAYYNFQPGEIQIVPKVELSDEFYHVEIKEGIYLKVRQESLQDLYKRRVVTSYLMCLTEYTRFSLRDLVATHPVYYKTVLGKYTYPSTTNAQLLYDNAEKHLETTATLLDPPARYQLSTIGICVEGIYDLLREVFYNIDRWIVSYEPTNLFAKKIGSLSQLMAPLVSSINTKQFNVINAKNEGLTKDSVKRFVTTASQGENWMMANAMFRANPVIYNDNTLLSVLTKRFRSLENTETKAASGGRNMPVALLKAHPSQLVIESILSLPPSSPVVTGEINPMVQIDMETGFFIIPEWYPEIEHVFD